MKGLTAVVVAGRCSMGGDGLLFLLVGGEKVRGRERSLLGDPPLLRDDLTAGTLSMPASEIYYVDFTTQQGSYVHLSSRHSGDRLGDGERLRSGDLPPLFVIL